MAGTWYLVLTAGMAAVGIRENGTEAQKETYLPDIANGERNFSIGITEPEAGTNTLNVATRAEKDGDEYVLNGQKAWITFSDRADNMIIVTRTTPLAEVDRGTDGISLFIVDMDDPGIDVSPIPKHGINYSKSCEVFLEDVRVPEENLLRRGRRGLVGARRYAESRADWLRRGRNGDWEAGCRDRRQVRQRPRSLRYPDRQPSGRFVPLSRKPMRGWRRPR